MWKAQSILTLNTDTKEWTKTRFETFHEWRKFVLSCWAFPGQYNLRNMEQVIASAITFDKTKRYCDYHSTSKEYKNFWFLERRKCEQGIIVDGKWISPDMYFFWNYCRIPNKLEGKETFPEIWDGHYHYDLYCQLAELYGQDVAGTKSRQKGISLYHVARLIRRLWFGRKHTLKIVSQEEEYVLGEWSIMQTYRNHLNSHTGWTRNFQPDESLNWEQKREVTQGVTNKKKVFKGNFCKIRGLTTKMNVTKAVGGCMLAGEQVFTTKGLKNIEDITTEDYVFGKDGLPKKVVKLFTGQDDIYKISQKYGDDYYVNSNHKLILQTQNHRMKNTAGEYITPTVLEWINLSKKTTYNRAYSGIKNIVSLQFEKQTVLIDPYLLGLWLGDGYSGKPGFIVNKTKDVEIIEFITNTDWGQSFSIKEKEPERYNDEMVSVLFRNSGAFKQDNVFYNNLKKYNLIKNKHIPDNYIYNTTEVRLNLLAGLIDTDGTYNRKRQCYEISTKDIKFANQIKLLCTTLGIYSSIREVLSKEHIIKNKKIISTRSYIIRMTVPEGTTIPCKVGRKQANIKRSKLVGSTPINISYHGYDTYYGFECEDHLYVLKDGTITHNSAKEIYITEAGINSKLIKTKEYVDPNMKMGNIKTGMFLAIGATGELKDAEDLMAMCFNPKGHNIRPVKDVFSGSEEDIGFFFPEEWNYVHEDEDTGEITFCYDKNGNSNLTLAIDLITKEDQRQRKNKDEAAYKLWKSQHPRTLQDAFDQREDNPFPTALLKEREFELLNKKQIIVRLKPNPNKKDGFIHEFSNDVPITKLNPNPNEDNSGAIVVYEFPIDNPPFGLYYAGVDPIYNKDTSTSRSLMSIRIWIGTHERDGKICEPYPVAHYIGRHKNVRDTYQICLDLIKWYNARTAVESNVKDFIEWVIKQGDSRYLMRRRELTAINELSPDSTIRDEIGVYMEGKFKDRCLEKYINWLQTPIGASFDLESGDSKEIYNISKINDPILIKECLRFNYKKNTDRLISDMLALIAAQTDTNRHIITTIKNPFKQEPKITFTKLPTVFKSTPKNNLVRIPSPFSKKF